MSRKNLAKKIKMMRYERSWSQSQLAEIANLSLRTIQRIESSGYCSHETLLSMAAAFDIDVKEFTKIILENRKGHYWNSLKNMCKPKVYDLSRREDIVMKISKFGTAVVGAGLFYLVLLLGITALGAAAFHQFYESLPPKIEAQLNVGYRQFLFISILGLALLLGIWSAIFGLWRQRIWKGIIALGCGVIVTIGTFSILPWIQYPNDQYPASAAFVFGGMLPCLISWVLVTTLGKYLNKKSLLNQAAV